jgi:ABC-type nitrate/sulfonate/bicarbonate transport system substrate-binding protein
VRRIQKFSIGILAWLAVCCADPGLAAEKVIVATPGLSIRYTPLYYGQEFGFFRDEGLDVQVIVVRAGQVGIASLLSGEVDAITHAGTALAAAIRGLPVKIISVTSDRPNHELFVAPSIRRPQDLKGKSIGLGSLEGTGGIIIRRMLQAKGLNPDKDVTFISMATEVRLQALVNGTIAAAMLTPPYTFLAADQGFQLFGRGKDYVRYLTEGVVTAETKIKQKRPGLTRFLRGWNRSAKFYRANPAVMVSYIQKKFAVKESRLAEKMYQEDAQNRTENGDIDTSGAVEILDIAKETMRVKASIPVQQVFDFSLNEETK